MTTKLVALVLLCLMTGTAMAQQAKVTSLMSKELTENPGKEVLMITVEYPPGAPEFWGEVQPPASLKGLDIPSRRAVFVPWKPSRRPVFGMGNPTFR